MKLIVISSPNAIKGESSLINRLFDDGLEILHLRKPLADKELYTKLLDQIAVEYRSRLALHDHHELAADFGVNRLHYPESRRKAQAVGSFRKQKASILSTGIHQVEDFQSVSDFDYTFLSPVFDSYSKTGYKGAIRDDFNLQQQKNTIGMIADSEVIALGGIGIDNIEKIKRMGFDGAALLGWIWNDPLKALNNFKQVKCWTKENT